jgi:hypothetical protein
MGIQTIKQAIKTDLDALVTSSVLGYAAITDIRKDPLAADHPRFPAAYLMPPAVESETLDNRTNTRTYAFDILVVFNADNLTSTTQLEEKVESFMNKFDNDPTLGGSALGGMSPVSSAPEPYQQGDKRLILVVVTIKAKALVDLTFS